MFEPSGGVRFDPEQWSELRYLPNMRADGTPRGPWDLISRIDPDHGDGREVRFLVDLPEGTSGRVSLSVTWWGGPGRRWSLLRCCLVHLSALGFAPVALLGGH